MSSKSFNLLATSCDLPNPILSIKTRIWSGTDCSFPAVIQLNEQQALISYVVKRPESIVHRPKLKFILPIETLEKKLSLSLETGSTFFETQTGSFEMPASASRKLLKTLLRLRKAKK